MVSILKDGAVRLTCLNSLKSGKIKLCFDLGSLNHPIYGVSEKLRGEFQLFHPVGAYRISNYFELSKSEQDKLLKDAVKRLRRLKEELEEEELLKTFGVLIITVACCYPGLDARSKQFEIAIDIFTLAFSLDDPLEDHKALLDVDSVYKSGWDDVKGKDIKILRNDSSQFKIYKVRLLQKFPEFTAAMDIIEGLHPEILKECPGGKLQKYLEHSTGNVIEANLFRYRGPGPVAFSEETLRFLRAYDGGIEVTAELAALLEGIQVPKIIRNTLLFQLLLKFVRDFGALLNDLLGLNKDIDEEGTYNNEILRRVVREGISVHQAFTDTFSRLKDCILDMNIVVERLRLIFADEGDVQKFVQCCLDVCDGQVLSYIIGSQRKSRYGFIQMQLISVETNRTKA